MHAATLKSQRLQRVADLLNDGGHYSTLQIIQYTNVCAVNSIIAELRANGMAIECERRGARWYYWKQA